MISSHVGSKIETCRFNCGALKVNLDERCPALLHAGNFNERFLCVAQMNRTTIFPIGQRHHVRLLCNSLAVANPE